MQSADVVATIHEFLSVVKLGAPFWTAIGILLAYIYVRVRVGSSHFIRERIWRILGGAKEFNDQSMAEQWKRINDFERYKYNVGIRFQNSQQIRHLQKWLGTREVALEELLPVAGYYDYLAADLRDPHANAREKRLKYYSVLWVVWVSFFGLFLFKDALLKVTATDTHFWVSAASARSAFSDSWEVTIEDCKRDYARLKLKDKEVICRILTTDEGQSFIESTSTTQREVGAFMIVIGILVWVVTFFSLLRAIDANNLYKRTRLPPSMTEQTDPIESLEKEGLLVRELEPGFDRNQD